MRRDTGVIAYAPQKSIFAFFFIIATELENLPGLGVLNYALMHMHGIIHMLLPSLLLQRYF